MKKTDDSSTAKNGKLFKSSVVVLIVAIFMFLQHPGFSGQKVQSKRNYEFKNYEDVEKKTAALASVMNAIALHSELLNGTGTARKVLSEALGVQDDSLFDLINQTNIRDVVNSIAFFDASIHQPMRIIKEIPEYLDKLSLHNSINLAGPPISNMLPSLIGISEEILGIFTDIHNINITMISIVDEIKKPSWDDEVVLDSVMNLRINVGDVFIKRRRVEKKKVVESLNLFVWDFEQYQLRMDFIFLNNLNKGLDSLQHSATKIQAWLNSGDHKRIAKQLKIVNGLTSTTAKILDNEALIGFPQGSRDLKKLPKYLKSKWFKNILNDGKSLNELEGQLQPIVQFWKDVARAERLWTKSSRRHWSNAIGQSLKNFEKIDAFNSTSISSALTNMSAIIRKHIANFNIPFFDEFQQLLNSSKILTSFNIKLKAIEKPIDFLKNRLISLSYEFRQLTTEPEKRDKLRNEFSSDNYKNLNLLREFREENEQLIMNFVKKLKEFNSTKRDDLLTNIRAKIEFLGQSKSDINAVREYVEFLKTLYMLTKEEREAIQELPDFFMVAKSIMNESEMMSKSLKSKIEATKGLRRLKEFTSARDTALQLVYTQHALILYQRPDLHQICQRFIKSGMALAEKIRKLSLSEREFIGFQQIDFSSVNSSMIDFLSDVKRLPQMMVVEGKSLKSFGHGLFVLDKVEMPFVDFDSMIKTLDRSKLTSIGRSKEVLEAEKSLESFKSLQYALRNKNSLFELLARADTFFESFFFKPLILKTKWTSIALIIISLATILLVVLLCWFLRTRNFENKRETAGKFDVKGKCKQMKSISAQRFVHIEAKGKDRYQEGRRKASK